MKNILGLAAIAAFTTFGMTATAATFTIDGGTAGYIPTGNGTQETTPQNNVLEALEFGEVTNVPDVGDIRTLGGFYNAGILLDEASPILIEVMGAEASFLNKFEIGDYSYQHTGGLNTASLDEDGEIVPLETATVTLAPGEGGLLDFIFQIVFSDDGGLGTTIANGANQPNGEGPNFFASFGNIEQTIGSTDLWLFFDDAGQQFDNHDDLVVRLSIVPLPAGMLLLLTGMGGLGAVGARRRRKAAA